MTKKIIHLALCSLLFAPCVAVDAQQPTKVPRIGYLLSGDSSSESERFESLRLALRELGYIEDRTSLSSTDTQGNSIAH